MSAVATERGRFHVHRSGNAVGPPLVLVGGLADDHSSWGGVLPHLEAHYDGVAFDIRGIGATPITPGPYTIAMLAQDTQAMTGHKTFWEQPEAWAPRALPFLDDTTAAR